MIALRAAKGIGQETWIGSQRAPYQDSSVAKGRSRSQRNQDGDAAPLSVQVFDFFAAWII